MKRNVGMSELEQEDWKLVNMDANFNVNVNINIKKSILHGGKCIRHICSTLNIHTKCFCKKHQR